MLRCLIVDNYDSFTWNLQQDIAKVFKNEPLVIRNDELSWQQLQADLNSFSCVVISPGPGNPANPLDIGLSYQLAKQNQIPVLGVCLGFQILLLQSGATVSYANQPYHGRLSAVLHQQQDIFAGIASPFEVVRYHSLQVSNPLPAQWQLIAQTAEGVAMAARHRQLPKWGVQFHPESILTQHGTKIISNFHQLVQNLQPKATANNKIISLASLAKKATNAKHQPSPKKIQLNLIGHSLALPITTEQVFTELYSEQDYAFWLDSSDSNYPMARFSFFGAVSANHVLQYSIRKDDDKFSQGKQFLQQLQRQLDEVQVKTDLDLPFSFRGGFVGCFSYEMKALFEGQLAHHNQHDDASLLKVQCFIAYDHHNQLYWLLALEPIAEQADVNSKAKKWLANTKQQLQQLVPSNNLTEKKALLTNEQIDWQQLSVQLSLPEDNYQKALQQCQNFIKNGESYEICLTNRFDMPATKLSPIKLYKELRQNNPAPWAAYLKFNSWQVLSSSPELFLRCTSNGTVMSKPIKGTVARHKDAQADQQAKNWLQNSEKDRAENLMIVDLMRNDLAKICQTGSITVPQLMQVESFASVHQLVSTVQGKLKDNSSILDILQATFPAGSITGAPKIRTMQIIDQLEPTPRGIFCGCIGYLGYGGATELNVAIRTLVCCDDKITAGAGGAITYLSDHAAEWQEVKLKANAVLQSIQSEIRSKTVRDMI